MHFRSSLYAKGKLEKSVLPETGPIHTWHLGQSIQSACSNCCPNWAAHQLILMIEHWNLRTSVFLLGIPVSPNVADQSTISDYYGELEIEGSQERMRLGQILTFLRICFKSPSYQTIA